MMYHVASGLYRPGDTVLPGNWGRLIQGTGPNHQFYFREFAWEFIRRSRFPGRVSRLEAAYGFAQLEGAIAHQLPGEYIYGASVPDSVKTDELDMTWLTSVRDYRTYDGVESVIERYWRGEVVNPQNREILAAGPLLILNRVTRIAEDGHVRPVQPPRDQGEQ
jgi:hypothetical protein